MKNFLIIILLFPFFCFCQTTKFKPYKFFDANQYDDTLAVVPWNWIVNNNVKFAELKTSCKLSSDNLFDQIKTLQFKDTANQQEITKLNENIVTLKKDIFSYTQIIVDKSVSLKEKDILLDNAKISLNNWVKKYRGLQAILVVGTIVVAVEAVVIIFIVVK